MLANGFLMQCFPTLFTAQRIHTVLIFTWDTGINCLGAWLARGWGLVYSRTSVLSSRHTHVLGARSAGKLYQGVLQTLCSSDFLWWHQIFTNHQCPVSFCTEGHHHSHDSPSHGLRAARRTFGHACQYSVQALGHFRASVVWPVTGLQTASRSLSLKHGH